MDLWLLIRSKITIHLDIMVNFVAFHHCWYFPCSCVLVVRRIPQLEKAGQEQAEGRCPRRQPQQKERQEESKEMKENEHEEEEEMDQAKQDDIYMQMVTDYIMMK